MLRLHAVAKTYAVKGNTVPALREVDVHITARQLTAVLGPSGSGKSTLLRIVAGFERPERGTVTLDERVLAGPGVFVRPERRGIGIVPQDGALFPHLDVASNIAFGLTRSMAARLNPTHRRERRDRAEELLAMVGLPGYERRRVDELSGGEQQRVALARALAPNPKVILLDEPFSAIDAALRAELGAEVRALLRRLQITTVLVTHDQGEALSLADEVVVMRAGRIAQSGTPQQVYRKPADAATARFVGDAMVLPAQVVGLDNGRPQVHCQLGTMPVGPGWAPEPGTACQVVLRPEHLVVGGPDSPGVPARIESSEYYGHDAMLTVRLDPCSTAEVNGQVVRVRVRDLDSTTLAGRAVRIRVTGLPLLLPIS